MLIVTDADIFGAVHANHEAAANRTVVYITNPQPKPEKTDRELPAYEDEKAPYIIPSYVYGTVWRFALAFGFTSANQLELIHPILAAILALSCGLWAVCYWAKKRWND